MIDPYGSRSLCLDVPSHFDSAKRLEQGLDVDERTALKVRVVLRELLGRINLKPEAATASCRPSTGCSEALC